MTANVLPRFVILRQGDATMRREKKKKPERHSHEDLLVLPMKKVM